MGSVIGGIASGAGQIVNSEQEKKNAISELFLGHQQDIIDQQAGGSVRQAGLQQAQAALLKGGQTVGAARTALASSGVDTQSGSAAEVQTASRGMSALDALTIENNAARSAWGYEVQGAMAREQSQLDSDNMTAKAQADEISGYGQIASSLFGGASSMGGGK